MDSLYRLARQSVPAFVERKKKLIGSQLPRIGGRWLVGWVKREKKRARQLFPLKMKFAVEKKNLALLRSTLLKETRRRPTDRFPSARARKNQKKTPKTKAKTKKRLKGREKKEDKTKEERGAQWVAGEMERPADATAADVIDDIDRRYRSTISIEDISISMPQRRTVATGRVARKWKQNRAPLNSNPFQSALNTFPMRRTQENPVKPSNTHGNSK